LVVNAEGKCQKSHSVVLYALFAYVMRRLVSIPLKDEICTNMKKTFYRVITINVVLSLCLFTLNELPLAGRTVSIKLDFTYFSRDYTTANNRRQRQWTFRHWKPYRPLLCMCYSVLLFNYSFLFLLIGLIYLNTKWLFCMFRTRFRCTHF